MGDGAPTTTVRPPPSTSTRRSDHRHILRNVDRAHVANALKGARSLESVFLAPTIVCEQVTEIHAIGPENWRDIRDIRLRSLADSPEAFTSSVQRESAYDEQRWRELAASGRWFVADDGGPVGVAVGVAGWSGDSSKRELVGMWVEPSHRRLGVASALFERVKTWASSEGATVLSLGVREGNGDALAAYLRMGLRPSGETMTEAGQPTKTIVVMECDLDPT